MADLTIDIPLPVLKAGEKFKVRYREYPGGAWSAYTDRTNSPFTISGLSDGTVYEFEYIFVEADSSECPAVLQYFETPTPFDCGTVTSISATMAKVATCSTVTKLTISYSITSPFVDPPCGWEVRYTHSQGKTVIPFATLDLSGSIVLTVPNESLGLELVALLCGGKEQVCFSTDTTPVTAGCTGFANLNLSYRYGPQDELFIQAEVDQSCTETANLNFKAIQTSVMQPGVLPDVWAQNVSWYWLVIVPYGNKLTYEFQAHPNNYIGSLSYQISWQDACGNWITGSITIP